MGLVYLVFQERGPYPRSHSLAEYPVLCCYYDPAWSNKTQHGDWAYDLTRDFHHEQCTHAVFVGARYSHLGVTLPESASAALPAFLSLRRGGLSMLASVLVEDTIRAAEDASRFADTVVDWLRKHDFDGLDLDLRDPATAHGYDLLVKALIPEMRRPGQRLILSVNVYPATRFMDDVNVKQLQQDADFLVLNVQDLVDPDQRTAAPSALYGRHSWNSSLAAVYTRTGSISRLVPVVAFMSREFELLKPISGTTAVSRGLECRGLAAPSRHHVTPGSRAFFEVCEMLDDPSWFRAWQNEDYCNMQAKEKRFLALEDRESVICKVKFAAAHRLAGVALKQMHLDAFRPSEECGPASPLMDAVLTEVHRLRPSTDVKQRWARPQRRLMVVRANGKTTCLSHSH